MRCNCFTTGNGRCRAEGNFAMPYNTECSRELDESNLVGDTAMAVLNGAVNVVEQVADTIVQIEIADAIGSVVEGIADAASSILDD